MFKAAAEPSGLINQCRQGCQRGHSTPRNLPVQLSWHPHCSWYRLCCLAGTAAWALKWSQSFWMTEAVCKTGHTEHLAAFGRVQYQSKQGMEALHTPIISIRHRVSLICSFQVQIWRYNVLISSLNISAQGPFFPIADTLLILMPYHHPLSVIFSA